MTTAWDITVTPAEPTIEVGYTVLSEAELADIKSKTPFETPFVGSLQTIHGKLIGLPKPNGRFRMVDENSAAEVRRRLRNRKAEEFKLLVEAEDAFNEIFNIDPYQATTESGVRTISSKF
jgi:hypothetical protein